MLFRSECPAWPCSRDKTKKSLGLTSRWAKRCKKYFDKHKKKGQLLFGIIQGSIYKDLRMESAKQIIAIGFDGYAIGGVAVGEPRQYLPKILKWTLPLLPKDNPRYLMGLGKPEEIVTAAKNGIDLFDCVIPTREARHGRLYLWSGELSLRGVPLLAGRRGNPVDKTNKKFYETINILNSKYKLDTKSINNTNLKDYSRAYLHHLFKMNEPLGMKLATIQNLGFYLELMKDLRSKFDK